MNKNETNYRHSDEARHWVSFIWHSEQQKSETSIHQVNTKATSSFITKNTAKTTIDSHNLLVPFWYFWEASKWCFNCKTVKINSGWLTEALELVTFGDSRLIVCESAFNFVFVHDNAVVVDLTEHVCLAQIVPANFIVKGDMVSTA